MKTEIRSGEDENLEKAVADSYRQASLLAIHQFLDEIDERLRRIETFVHQRDKQKEGSEAESV